MTAVVDSFAIFDALIGAGVHRVVVCPGSRSAPLAYAAAAWEAAGGVRVHTMIDERAAGFFALGLARATGSPAAVVMTSGTAPSHLHPAVIEAAHTGTPLLVVSADRPWQMQGVGASQTTPQAGLFTAHARRQLNLPAGLGVSFGDDESLKAVRNVVGRAAVAARRGAVHINVSFNDPLYPVGDIPPACACGAAAVSARTGGEAGALASLVGGGVKTSPSSSEFADDTPPDNVTELPVTLERLTQWARLRLAAPGFTQPFALAASGIARPFDRVSTAGANTAADVSGVGMVSGAVADTACVPMNISRAARASEVLDLDARTVIIAADRGYQGGLAAHAGTPAQRQAEADAALGDPLASSPARNSQRQHGADDRQGGALVAGFSADLAGTLAAQLGAPVLAEPSSGVKNSDQYCPHQQQVLTRWGSEIQQAIVVGTPSLSRPVGRLLARSDVRVVVIADTTDPQRPWPDVTGNASAIIEAIEIDRTLSASVQQWGEGLISRARAITAELSGTALVPGMGVARAVWDSLGGGEILLAGASNAVRYLDLVAAKPPAGWVVANRGQAGIDGTIATARGLHAGSGKPVHVLLGDMTLLHDVGSLALAEDECPDIDVVVIDDGGAQIFRSLEHGHAATESTYRELFQMDRGVNYAHLAAAFGWQYCDLDWEKDGEAGLANELDRYRGGPRLVRVRCDHSRVGEQLRQVLARAQ